MNLMKDRRKNLASVQKVLNEYNIGGVSRLSEYFNKETTIIEPDTWVEKIKKLLKDKNHWVSVGAEINQISENFKKTN